MRNMFKKQIIHNYIKKLQYTTINQTICNYLHG